jgi:hypothetical protein
MTTLRKATWIISSIVCGAALGSLLGYLDVLFLAARQISFSQPAAFQTAAQLLLRYVPIAVNGACGGLLGAILGILVVQAPGVKRANAITGALLGGILGALIGYADLALLSQYLNLASSDNASAWRENRSFLVMINAGFGCATGLLLGFAANRRR